MGRGMIQQAAAVGDALAGLEKLSGALAVIDVLHGAMVLLDSKAAGSEKVGAALEVVSGGIQVTGAAAGAVGAEGVAAAASEATPWAMAVTINYKAYKALAEYTYSSVVGGLATVDVSESLEGAPISTKGGTFRPGGLDDLGKAVTEARLRVESLERQLGAAPAGEGGGVQRAMGDQVSRLQRAIYGLQHQWSIAPLDAVRAYMPTWDLGVAERDGPGGRAVDGRRGGPPLGGRPPRRVHPPAGDRRGDDAPGDGPRLTPPPSRPRKTSKRPPKEPLRCCPGEAGPLPDHFCHVARASITPAAPATLTLPTHDLVTRAAVARATGASVARPRLPTQGFLRISWLIIRNLACRTEPAPEALAAPVAPDRALRRPRR